MRGKHSVQFGGEAQYLSADVINEFRRGGAYTFSGSSTGMVMADFLLGRMRSFAQGTGQYKNSHVLYSSAFFQDDYKVHRV